MGILEDAFNAQAQRLDRATNDGIVQLNIRRDSIQKALEDMAQKGNETFKSIVSTATDAFTASITKSSNDALAAINASKEASLNAVNASITKSSNDALAAIAIAHNAAVEKLQTTGVETITARMQSISDAATHKCRKATNAAKAEHDKAECAATRALEAAIRIEEAARYVGRIKDLEQNIKEAMAMISELNIKLQQLQNA